MRIRLKERCFIGGRVCEAGEVITLAKGEKGPHRAVSKTHDRIDYDPANGLDANRILGDIVDEPLYDVLPDKEIPRAADEVREAEHAVEQRKNAQASAAIQASKGKPETKPAPPQRSGEVRVLTHTEERQRR